MARPDEPTCHRQGFQELDEVITVRADEVAVPLRVRWTCLAHIDAPAWTGSTIAPGAT